MWQCILRAERTAKRLGISRSELFTRAVGEFLGALPNVEWSDGSVGQLSRRSLRKVDLGLRLALGLAKGP